MVQKRFFEIESLPFQIRCSMASRKHILCSGMKVMKTMRIVCAFFRDGVHLSSLHLAGNKDMSHTAGDVSDLHASGDMPLDMSTDNSTGD